MTGWLARYFGLDSMSTPKDIKGDLETTDLSMH